MNFSIYISTLCLLTAALVYQDTSALNIDGYASSYDCGGSGSTVSGTFSANPTGPSTISLSGNVQVDEELDSPLKAVAVVGKKFLWRYWKLPCVNRYGSCTYQDVCQILHSSVCPVEAATYTIQTEVNIPSGLPYWLVSGDYLVRVRLYKSNREVGCNEIEFSV